jgi:hypothetical protein
VFKSITVLKSNFYKKRESFLFLLRLNKIKMSSSLNKLCIRNSGSFKQTKLYYPHKSIPRVIDSPDTDLKNRVHSQMKTTLWIPYGHLKKFSNDVDDKLIDIYYPFRQLELSKNQPTASEDTNSLFDLKDQNIVIYQKILAMSKENRNEQLRQNQLLNNQKNEKHKYQSRQTIKKNKNFQKSNYETASIYSSLLSIKKEKTIDNKKFSNVIKRPSSVYSMYLNDKNQLNQAKISFINSFYFIRLFKTHIEAIE